MQDVWQYSTTYKCACKVIEEQTLWGQTVCRIWLPNQDAVVQVPSSALTSLNADLHPTIEISRISYVAAAAKVAEVLYGGTNAAAEHVLLAPMESNVIPLPHQIHALSRAISGDSVRYLLADEVGLGKTIEAGLVMRELKLRGQVQRTLVVAPKSLAMQWVAEMNTHFNETFALINPSDLDALERLECPEQFFDDSSSEKKDYNPWLRFPQAIVTLDAVKPLARRKGWSKEKIRIYNQNRYEKLVHGKWDLVIVDESHKLGGSTDQVARFKLGQGLAEAAPYLLLLSATPHQGKSDAFHRLISLLDPMAFPDIDSVTRDRIAAYVIRTEKRRSVTAQGAPLFRPRITKTLGVDFSANPAQVALYDAVTRYVKESYNLAIKDRKPHIGFLMVLLQRIVTSSTHAIHCTLERRLQVLKEIRRKPVVDNGADDFEELEEMDGQAQLDFLVEIDEPGRVNEIAEVESLLRFACDAASTGPDVKAVTLINLIYQLQGEENDDQLKLLIFTEFVPTQTMLKQFLEERGITCATLNGSMSMDERRMAQRDFREKARILISTDAGGEGLNLQFCHVVINYDLPWNPMRIEQRIGRVDRIGQDKVVRAMNFLYNDSVETRVREVLEAKLAIIFEQIGIDKAGDILDTALSGEVIEKMMTHVIMENADPEVEVGQTVEKLKNEILQMKDRCAVYSISDEPDLKAAEKLRNHPLPHWIERMTTGFLRMNECRVEKNLLGWNLTWPDGETVKNAVFQSKELDSDSLLLSLENSRIRGIALNLPQVAEGQHLPVVAIPGITISIYGLWGIYEIRLSTIKSHGTQIRTPAIRRAYVSVFLSEDGKLFLPTARHIWTALQTTDPQVLGTLSHDESITAHARLLKVAEQAGQELFEVLQQEHINSVAREEERGVVAFGSRRKAIKRVGLPEVRQYRLAQCDAEEAEWRNEMKSVRQIVPEIRPLLLMSIIKGGAR